MRAPKLVAQIAAGRLGCKMTEPYIYGTYLELWWRCLKFSKEFTQSCRTGIFTSRDAYRTFCIFGNLEDLTFQEWWLIKGHEFFSESITTLHVTLYVKRQNSESFEITVDAFQEVSSQLAGKEFGFWLDQINLLNAKLLYTNRIFRQEGLTNEQKVRILESFDRAVNVREVKMVYTTLVETLTVAAKSFKSRATSSKVVTEGLASKRTASTAPKKEILEENTVAKRLQLLAGIL
jgi:hypothetical protein